MKIINLDSKYDLSAAQISFAENVLIYGANNRLHPIEESLISVKEKVPVFLASKETMNLHKVEIPVSFESERQENPSTDALGLYLPCANLLGCKKPAILLCVEKLVELSVDDEQLSILIAKVLVHEFAHAFMDLDSKYPNGKDQFHEWIEEALANFITLEYFKNYSENLVEKTTTITSPLSVVEDFISKQPANYQLGLIFFQNQLNIHRFKDWYRSKDKFVDEQGKKDFIDYVKKHFYRQPQSYEWDLEILLDFAQGTDRYNCKVSLIRPWKNYESGWSVEFVTTQYFTSYPPYWSKKMADEYNIKYEAWLQKEDCDVQSEKID